MFSFCKLTLRPLSSPLRQRRRACVRRRGERECPLEQLWAWEEDGALLVIDRSWDAREEAGEGRLSAVLQVDSSLP